MNFDIEKLIRKNRIDGALPISPATRALNPHVDFERIGKTKVKHAQHKAGVMNSTEASYADHLQRLKQFGTIIDYGFEVINLKLADKTHYRPDFFVITSKGTLQFHEVKGFWRDDARVKIKIAAQMFPHFIFIAVTKQKGGVWKTELFHSTQRT